MLTKRGSFLRDNYTFDPHFWLESSTIKNKIETGVKNPTKITEVKDDNTYSFEWNFETNVEPNIWKTYMLQTLEINGEPVAVPYYSTIVGSPNVSEETTLSTGTHITITLTQIKLDDLSRLAGGRSQSYRRVYKMKVDNASENLTITGGSVVNVIPSQNSLREDSGLEVQYYIYQGNGKSQWIDKKKGDVIPAIAIAQGLASANTLLYGQYDNSASFLGNVRFKPRDGFTAPTSYLYQNSAGKKVTDGLVQGPDAEGWYYIKLTNSSGNRFTSLFLQGVPKNYAVRYLEGTPESGQVSNMPAFNNGDETSIQQNIDANGGAYYHFSGRKNGPKTMINIASAPKNIASEDQNKPFVADTFLSWAVAENAGGTLKKDDEGKEISVAADSTISLEDLAKYAVYDSAENMYVIYLVPHWQNNSFRYFVDFEWSTPDGTQMQTTRMQSNAKQFAVSSGAQRRDESLRVVVKSDADFIRAWLESHPGYVLSKDNQYVQEVKNGGTIKIKFELVPAKLEVTKKLVDENEELQLSSRDFPMTLTLTYPDDAVDMEGNSLAGKNLGPDYNGNYSYTVKKQGETGSQAGEKKTLTLVNGQGTFDLKSGETAVFDDLPNGTVYDIKETTPTGFTADYTNKTDTLSSEVSSVTVTNRRTVDLTIRKVVAGDAADKNKEWHFTITLTNGDDTVTDEFELKNGQAQVFRGWAAGTTYTITETEAGKDGYRTIISGADDKGNGTASGVLRAAEAENGITVTYTNTNHAGNLIINKVVGGNGGDPQREFEFHLELTDPDDEELKDSYSYIDADGKTGTLNLTDEGDKKTADFKLKHGQMIIISDLPTDTGYKVTEQPVTGITPSYSVYWYRKGDTEQQAGNTVSGKFPRTTGNDAEDINITFANIREVNNALTITKTVVNGKEKEPTKAQKETNFTFTITLEHASLDESYTYINAEDKREPLKLTKNGNIGTATVTLRHGQFITIEGLPSGTKYTVKENPVNGYAAAKEINGVLQEEPVRIDFMNQTDTYDLTIHKMVVGTPMVSGQEFTVHITLTGADGNPITGQYAYDGAAEGTLGSSGAVKLKDGEKITIHGLPAGTKYNVSEEATEGYTVAYPKGASDTLQNDSATVEIQNTTDTGSALEVIKQVEGSGSDGLAFDIQITLRRPDGAPLDGTYTYMTSTGGSGTITDGFGTVSLKNGETATVTGLPYGADYQVAEISTGGYTVRYDAGNSGTFKGRKEQVTVISTPIPAHNLVITKKVEGTGADENDSFSFNVDLTVPKGSARDTEHFSYTGPDGKTGGVLEYTEDGWTATPEIRLRSGQSVTISGLPEGTEYSVTENEAGENGYSTESEKNLGVIGTEDVTVTYTNTRRTALTIGKLVTGKDAPMDREFTFRVVLTPPVGTTLADSYPCMDTDAEGHTDAALTLEDGTNGTKIGTVKLKHEQGITILDLPAGTSYEVTESGNEGFISTARNETGTLSAAAEEFAKTALFVNEWQSPVNLTIRKITTGNLADAAKEWNFEIQLTAPNGVTLAESYTYTDEKGKEHNLQLSRQGTTMTGTLALHNGDSATILGLPVGTAYTVTETEANQGGYTTSVTGADKVVNGSASGTLSDEQIQSGVVITFINTFSSGNLIVTKEVSGAGGNQYRDFDFTILLSAADGVTLEDAYSYTDAQGNEYTLELTDKGDGKEGTFHLQHGGTFILEGLPGGTKYTVTEQPVSGVTPAYSTSYRVDNGTEQTGRIISGQIPTDKQGNADDVAITVINKRETANTLTITKHVAGIGGEKDRYFDFTVTLLDPKGNALKENFIYTGSSFGTISSGDSVSLLSGDSIIIEGLPEGTQYTVSEEEKEGYTVEATNSAGTITSDTEADFVNTRTAAPLTITKRQFVNDVEAEEQVTVTGGDKITYELTVENTGNVAATNLTVIDVIPSGLMPVEGSITYLGMLEDGVITWTFPQLDAKQQITVSFAVTVPHVTEGTVWENTANIQYDNAVPNPDSPDIGQIVTSNTVTAIAYAEGEVHTGSLTVRKTVTGPGAEKERAFTFIVSLTDESGDELTDQFIYTGSEVDTLHSGDTFVLRHGESITIEGLPEGTNYMVSEVQTEDYAVTANGASGTIKDQTESTASFINTRKTASLTFTKRQLLNGEAVEDSVIVKAGDAITYELTLKNTGEVKATDIVITDPIPSGLLLVENSISDGGTVTGNLITWNLSDLVGGQKKTVSFTVTVPSVSESMTWENMATLNYYHVPETEGTVQTSYSNAVKATIQPEEKNGTGSLTITKTVTGTAGDMNKAFTFTVTFTDEAGNVLAGTFSYEGTHTGMIQSGGTIYLCHGESITIHDLPAGTKYMVSESDNEGYTVVMSGETGMIEAGKTSVAAFENHKENHKDAAASQDKPKTGDTAYPVLCLIFMLMSLSGFCMIYFVRRQKKIKKPNDKS